MKKRKDKKRKLKELLIFSISGLLLINVSIVSSYMLLTKFGSLTLYPGEKYTLNIPFIGPSKSPVICGKTLQTDGTPISEINVSVYLNKTGSLIGSNVSKSDGKFCISMPEINTSTKYDVFVEYNNETLILGSNDYTLEIEDNKTYSKSVDSYVVLTGKIINQDAPIENGRFEINLQYWPSNTSERFEVFGYQKYFVNILPNENHELPNSELNVSWPINENTLVGRYKFYIKTSFNAKEKTKNIYFNIVE